MIGIYYIKCLQSNRLYIGSSLNINRRLATHKTALNRNKHPNSYLQNVWNKYNIENFEFGIFEICKKEELLSKENVYIQQYNTLDSNSGFNLVVAERKDDLYCNKDYLYKLSMAKKGKIPSNFYTMKLLNYKPIVEYENGEYVTEYSSAAEAGRVLNISYKLINNVLRKYTKHVRKYPNKTWKYKEDMVL